MGGYDLYGTYYPNVNDAINAEMAQCAAIDADIAMREVNKIKAKMQHPDPLDDEFNRIWEYIKRLEEKIDKLQQPI